MKDKSKKKHRQRIEQQDETDKEVIEEQEEESKKRKKNRKRKNSDCSLVSLVKEEEPSEQNAENPFFADSSENKPWKKVLKKVDNIEVAQERQADSNKEVMEKLVDIEKKVENIEEAQEIQADFNKEVMEKLKNIEKLCAPPPPKTIPLIQLVEKVVDTQNDGNADKLIPLTGKWLTLKHTFKDVSSYSQNSFAMPITSEYEEHFGVFWKLEVRREEDHVKVNCVCRNEKPRGAWSINTKFQLMIYPEKGNPKTWKSDSTFEQAGPRFLKTGCRRGPDISIEWKKREEYLDNDSLVCEAYIKIKSMTGIYKNDLRCFDETKKYCSDMALVVDDRKFFVSGLFLAEQSLHFKNLFRNTSFMESNKSENHLFAIEAEDFQKYLEVLYGESAIDEFTVEGILTVADIYSTETVTRRCVEFLKSNETNNKSLKTKLHLSVKYRLDDLKKFCLDQINTAADIRKVLPADVRYLDPSLKDDLLEKLRLST